MSPADSMSVLRSVASTRAAPFAVPLLPVEFVAVPPLDPLPLVEKSLLGPHRARSGGVSVYVVACRLAAVPRSV